MWKKEASRLNDSIGKYGHGHKIATAKIKDICSFRKGEYCDEERYFYIQEEPIEWIRESDFTPEIGDILVVFQSYCSNCYGGSRKNRRFTRHKYYLNVDLYIVNKEGMSKRIGLYYTEADDKEQVVDFAKSYVKENFNLEFDVADKDYNLMLFKKISEAEQTKFKKAVEFALKDGMRESAFFYTDERFQDSLNKMLKAGFITVSEKDGRKFYNTTKAGQERLNQVK